MFNDFIPNKSGGQNNFFSHSNIDHVQPTSFEKPGIALIVLENSSLVDISVSFSKYKNHFGNIEIYDCGILSTYDHIDQIIKFLKSKGILPFIIGNDLERISIYAANNSRNIYHLSNQISYINADLQGVNQNYIGYQRHLCEYDDIQEIESYHANSMSLGKIRTYGYLTEPVLRDSHLIYMDSNVFRASDCPENLDCLPTGMQAEEICQIFRYLGSSSDLDAIFFNDNNITIRSAHLIAESFWYLAEGVNIRMKDHPAENADYSEFIVDSNEADELIFVKNNQTQRWWLKKHEQNDAQYLACAFEEYQACIENEIPERLQNFLI